jgi:hypothetical protein
LLTHVWNGRISGRFDLPFSQAIKHHVRNCKAFIEKLYHISLQEPDLLVSFDMVSLFTEVLVEDILVLFSQNFRKWTIACIKQVLTMTYFLYSCSFCDQRELGITPIISSFYIESFEQPILPASKLRALTTTWIE